jgi:hypothetical protein
LKVLVLKVCDFGDELIDVRDRGHVVLASSQDHLQTAIDSAGNVRHGARDFKTSVAALGPFTLDMILHAKASEQRCGCNDGCGEENVWNKRSVRYKGTDFLIWTEMQARARGMRRRIVLDARVVRNVASLASVRTR